MLGVVLLFLQRQPLLFPPVGSRHLPRWVSSPLLSPPSPLPRSPSPCVSFTSDSVLSHSLSPLSLTFALPPPLTYASPSPLSYLRSHSPCLTSPSPASFCHTRMSFSHTCALSPVTRPPSPMSPRPVTRFFLTYVSFSLACNSLSLTCALALIFPHLRVPLSHPSLVLYLTLPSLFFLCCSVCAAAVRVSDYHFNLPVWNHPGSI